MNVATFWGLRAGLQSIKAVLDAINKPVFKITFIKYQVSNPGRLGEERKHYVCAMPTPINKGSLLGKSLAL